MSTFTWKVNNLDRTLSDGRVNTVHYTVDARSDDAVHRSRTKRGSPRPLRQRIRTGHGDVHLDHDPGDALLGLVVVGPHVRDRMFRLVRWSDVDHALPPDRHLPRDDDGLP